MCLYRIVFVRRCILMSKTYLQDQNWLFLRGVRSDPPALSLIGRGRGSQNPLLWQNPICKRLEIIFKRLEIERRCILIWKRRSRFKIVDLGGGSYWLPCVRIGWILTCVRIGLRTNNYDSMGLLPSFEDKLFTESRGPINTTFWICLTSFADKNNSLCLKDQ